MRARAVRTKICVQCGEEFQPFRGTKRKNLVCSFACWSEHTLTPLNEMTPDQVAWVAAVIDIKGCIVFEIGHPGAAKDGAFKLQVTSSDLPLLGKLTDITGVGGMVQRKKRELWHADTYDWRVGGPNVIRLLKLIRPWLVVKHEKADEALASGELQVDLNRQRIP